ncbi:MAG TPA: beta-N-acetylhexosaminidase, partial [Roseiflexaceae bacterium]|nr:beta-N-acetylhexosaminidase [Roseiflexaceae bacterium]
REARNVDVALAAPARAALRLLALLLAALALLACAVPPGPPFAGRPARDAPRQGPPGAPAAVALDAIIPRPASAQPAEGAFALTTETRVTVAPATPELLRIGTYLAESLRPATGFALPVAPANGAPAPAVLHLTTEGADPAHGEEGYELAIAPGRLTLTAYRPAGLFRGVQTIRQLLPAAVEHTAPQRGPWTLPAGTIRDWPRFAWRGAMLDVARHFFGPEDVKRLIDQIAYYKLNRLHLHLTDDQGWRIMIESWPRLATYGGSTAVGGGPGGYFTQAEYADIVTYAHERYITVVPEIDMPGHTHAALASYPELSCDGVAPPLYTGIAVGFSTLCVDQEITYTFVEDVIRELAALTPGPYIHIGGDEVQSLSPEQYRRFIERVQRIVQAHGKSTVGWEEIGQAALLPGTLVQHWRTDAAHLAVRQGAKIIMSPSSHVYLDMKYHDGTPIGLRWAGLIEVKDAYAWDPGTQVAGVTERDVLGVEAALWTETVATRDDIDHMAFPRLAAVAEVGWSPATLKDWESFRGRLAAHGPRLEAMGVRFYRSEQIAWERPSS